MIGAQSQPKLSLDLKIHGHSFRDTKILVILFLKILRAAVLAVGTPLTASSRVTKRLLVEIVTEILWQNAVEGDKSG